MTQFDEEMCDDSWCQCPTNISHLCAFEPCFVEFSIYMDCSRFTSLMRSSVCEVLPAAALCCQKTAKRETIQVVNTVTQYLFIISFGKYLKGFSALHKNS